MMYFGLLRYYGHREPTQFKQELVWIVICVVFAVNLVGTFLQSIRWTLARIKCWNRKRIRRKFAHVSNNERRYRVRGVRGQKFCTAQQLRDIANLREIAEARKRLPEERIDRLIGDHGGLGLGFHLAGYLGSSWVKRRCFIDDPSVYISSGDRYASQITDTSLRPKGIGKFVHKRGKQDLLMCYSRVENPLTDGNKTIVLSYCLIGGFEIEDFSDIFRNKSGVFEYFLDFMELCAVLGKPAPLKTLVCEVMRDRILRKKYGHVPLAFTRGLMSNGKWHKEYGLYGDKGGYVIFCDGHVQWFDGQEPATFKKYGRSGHTHNIFQALPEGSFIKAGEGLNNHLLGENARDKSVFVILDHRCYFESEFISEMMEDPDDELSEDFTTCISEKLRSKSGNEMGYLKVTGGSVSFEDIRKGKDPVLSELEYTISYDEEQIKSVEWMKQLEAELKEAELKKSAKKAKDKASKKTKDKVSKEVRKDDDLFIQR